MAAAAAAADPSLFSEPTGIEKIIADTNKTVPTHPFPELVGSPYHPDWHPEKVKAAEGEYKRRQDWLAEVKRRREAGIPLPKTMAEDLRERAGAPPLVEKPKGFRVVPKPVLKLTERQQRRAARKAVRDAAEKAAGAKFTPGRDTIGDAFRRKRDRKARILKRDALEAKAFRPLTKAGKFLETAGWVLPLVYMGAQGVKSAIRSNFNVGSKFFDGVTAVDEFLAQEKKAKNLADQERKRQMKLEMLRQQNLKVLRGLAPGLAASLEAGMELPEDGIMIGGRPRTDLLNSVADSMAAGGSLSVGM
jgi:hypothetical protein